MARYIDALLAYQDTFWGEDFHTFCRESPWVPAATAALYVLFVFAGPSLVKRKYDVRQFSAWWNLGLSIFSFLGVYFTVPHLLNELGTHGLWHTICSHPNKWHRQGAPGLWLSLFCMSKIPELVDTVFLVLSKKDVIFLHWYHHTTVMLYCWHAYVNLSSTGLWFCCMNYTVHSIMYFYYFAMSFNKTTRRLAKPFNMTITTLQISQMVWGMAVALLAEYWSHNPPNGMPCAVTPLNNHLCLVMYASYFLLFAQLFNKMYLQPKRDAAVAAVAAVGKAKAS